MRVENVLAITNWSYRDALIQTYTLPYIKLIRKNIPPSGTIYLVTLEQKGMEFNIEVKRRIEKELKDQGIIWIDFRFSKFGGKAIFERFIQLIKLWYLCIQKRIDYIHVWCTPAGVTGYLLSVISRKTLILDSFEPHAEPSVETGTWKANSFAFKFLFYFEKKQAERAKITIAASSFITDYAKDKWKIELKNIFVKPALVDLEKFNYESKKEPGLLKSFGLENKIVCVYAGKVGGIYLDNEIFDFIKVCHNYWGNKFRFFMITDISRKQIEEFCNNAKLDTEIVVSCFVQYNEIQSYIGAGDFAINPVKMVKSKRCCTSIKDGEYWAMGLPIVITNSVGEDVKIILDNNAGVVLESLDKSEYYRAVEKIDAMLKESTMSELYCKIRPIAEKYRNYDIAKRIYSVIYNSSTFSEE